MFGYNVKPWQDNNFVVESKIIQVGNLADEKGFKNPQRGRVYNPIGISPNINTMSGGNLQPKIIEYFANYRIRKLTPRECFRLMGVSEKDIDNIQKSGISKTQQYKMAGNSIVVDVLYYIFKKMFVDNSCEDAQLSILISNFTNKPNQNPKKKKNENNQDTHRKDLC